METVSIKKPAYIPHIQTRLAEVAVFDEDVVGLELAVLDLLNHLFHSTDLSNMICNLC
jgi:hypothetical protein